MDTTKTNFKIYLKESAQEIEKELKDFSNNLNTYTSDEFPDLKNANLKFTQSFHGGKMIRGTLVKLGYELVKKTSTKDILRPAAAFEVLHTSLLIHDDIIDKSSTRRGKPALHIHENSHYGISQAICLGDLGITFAFQLFLESTFPVKLKTTAYNYFTKIISMTILGEMLDVEISQLYERADDQILKIHEMKTATYTIVGPLTIGAMLAGANNTILKNVKLFGTHLGIAFQIQDDILGVFGDDQTIGKSTKSDIEENKSTLLFTYALKHADNNQKTILKQYYGKKNITSKQHEVIKKIFIETGSLKYSQKKIETLTEQAKEIIPLLTNDKAKTTLLTQFADLLIKREK